MLQINQVPDYDLIMLYRQGASEAADELVRRYYAVIRRWCRKYNYFSDDENDMTQEVLCKLFAEGKVFSFRRESKFRFWLYAVVRNTCIGLIRERRHKPEINLSEGDIEQEWKNAPAVNRTPEEDMIREEECSRLRWNVDYLAKKYSRPLHIFYYENKSYQESAAVLGVSLNTFGVQLKRGREMLGKLLTTRLRQHDFKLMVPAVNGRA